MTLIERVKHEAMRAGCRAAGCDGHWSSFSAFENYGREFLAAYENALWQRVDPETVPRETPIIIWNSLTNRSYPRVFGDKETIGENVSHWRPPVDGPPK